MIYKDPEILLHITHYGYSTGWGADGDWIFPGDKKFLQWMIGNDSFKHFKILEILRIN